MADYDVFNGDADGICALIQLRLAEPRGSELVTGVKRDIALLDRLAAVSDARICVLDVSLDKNRQGLTGLLERGAQVFYCDHHYAGEIPQHPALDVLINTGAEVCTSLLINGRLKGAHAPWAIVGAFGDNLDNSARALGRACAVDDGMLDLYRRLGTYVNYNGYGAALEDLHFHPAELFQLMACYPSPESFVSDASSSFQRLEQGYEDDMARGDALEPEWEDARSAVLLLPDAPWARRVSGVLGNALARRSPARAHAVLTAKPGGGYLVSVRAPLSDKRDADTLCRQFPTGGGRAAAAGINHLAETDVPRFVDALSRTYAA